jgi:hypothetical protein
MKKFIVLGFDPQPGLLAYHVAEYKYNNPLSEKTLIWQREILMKKACFDNAQQWQEYIWKICTGLFDKIERELSMKSINLVAIEQQRGRVNSLIEQSLLGCCMIRNLPRVIFHPATWKNLTGIPSLGSNAENKKYVKQLFEKDLQKFKFTDKRTHDLCDAKLISKAAYIFSIKK